MRRPCCCSRTSSATGSPDRWARRPRTRPRPSCTTCVLGPGRPGWPSGSTYRCGCCRPSESRGLCSARCCPRSRPRPGWTPPPGGRRRVARHRVRGGRRAVRGRSPSGVHLVRHLVAGGRRDRRPVLTEAARTVELHQRGRGRRHDPLPAQRDGALDAQRVPACVGPRECGRPAGLLADAEQAPAFETLRRRRRPGLHAAWRHAGRIGKWCSEHGVAAPETRAATRAVPPGEPGAGLPPDRAGCRPSSAASPSRWCTSSGEARATSCCAR